MPRKLLSVRWGRPACGWALIFAAAHFFWAVGGELGLDLSAGQELANDRPLWFVVIGLVGVGIAMVVLAGIALLLDGAAANLLRTVMRRRLLIAAGAAVSLLLLVRGLGLEALMLSGAVTSGDDIPDEQIFWSLVLWNPWFVLGGLLFAGATLRYRKIVDDLKVPGAALTV